MLECRRLRQQQQQQQQQRRHLCTGLPLADRLWLGPGVRDIGRDPDIAHPVFGSRMKKRLRQGARLSMRSDMLDHLDRDGGAGLTEILLVALTRHRAVRAQAIVPSE